jgi:hypothetical protein
VVREPFVDRGDVDGGVVADGELVVAGGHGPVALESADAAFDGVALLAGFWPCSQARCTLVVSPPRDRPRPWSSGSALTPPGGSACRSLELGLQGLLAPEA